MRRTPNVLFINSLCCCTRAERAAEMEEGNGQISLELARVRARCKAQNGALVALASALGQPMGPSAFEVEADPHFSGIDLSQLPRDN
jgi:hypothetical protein